MCGFSLPWNSTYFPARRNFRNSYNSPLGDKTLEKFWTRWKNVCRADLLSILKLLNLLVQPGRSGALWFLVETILWVAVVIAKSKIQDTQNEHCELLQSWDLILFWTHFSLILCLFYPMIQWWHIQTIYVQLTLFLQTRSDAIASIPSRGWESLGTGEGWRVAILAAAQSIATARLWQANQWAEGREVADRSTTIQSSFGHASLHNSHDNT